MHIDEYEKNNDGADEIGFMYEKFNHCRLNGEVNEAAAR